jgi:rod shape-determining protein MreD
MLSTVFIILGATLLIIQTTILTRMPSWIGSPDLLFLLVLFMATRMDSYRGIMLTLVYGLMMDIFSGIVPGLFPAVYLVLFVTIKYLSRHLIINEPTHQPPLAAASYLACSGAIYLYTVLFGVEIEIFWAWRDLLLQMLILAILTLPCFQLLDRLVSTLYSGQGRFFLRRKKLGNRFVA